MEKLINLDISENTLKKLAKKIAEGILDRGWTPVEVLSFVKSSLGDEIELDKSLFASLAKTVKNRWGFKLKNKTELVKRILEEAYEHSVISKLDDVVATLVLAKKNGDFTETASQIGLSNLQSYKKKTEDFSSPKMLSYYEVLEEACIAVFQKRLVIAKEAFTETDDNTNLLSALSSIDLDELYDELIRGEISEKVLSFPEKEKYLEIIIILKNRLQSQAQKNLDYLLDAQSQGKLGESLSGLTDVEIENMGLAIKKMTRNSKYAEYRNLIMEARREKRLSLQNTTQNLK